MGVVVGPEGRIRAEHDEHRGKEGKTGTEEGRCLALAEHEIDQGTDTVHQQHDGWIDLEQGRHQDRGAEHGKEVLET